jgi:hypothetical protein
VSLGSWQVDRYVVMRNPFIPPVQGPAGSFCNDGLLILLAGEAADGVNANDAGSRRLRPAMPIHARSARSSVPRPPDVSMQMETITGPNRVRPAGGEEPSEERTHLPRTARSAIDPGVRVGSAGGKAVRDFAGRSNGTTFPRKRPRAADRGRARGHDEILAMTRSATSC